MSSEPTRPPAVRRAALPTLLPLLLLLPLAALAAGCGKQGDPQPPLRTTPKATDELEVSQRGLELILELPYPTLTTAGLSLPGVDRVEVYEVVRPVPASFLEDPESGSSESGDGEESGDGAAAKQRRPEAEAMAGDDETAAEGEPGGRAEEEGREASGETAAPEGDGETGAEAESDEAVDDEEPALSPEERARQRKRQLLEPLRKPEFQALAEQRLSVEGQQLEAAVEGDRLLLRLALPDPLPEERSVHYLAVRTVYGEERSAFSNQARIVPVAPPEPLRQLVTDPRGDGILVSWEPQDRAIAGYNLYRRDARSRAFANPAAIPGPESTEFLDRTVRLGETYIYAVTAVAERNPLIESAITEVREVVYTDRFPPPVPGNPVALAEEGRVRVVWEGSDAPDLAGYLVSRRRGDGDFEPLVDAPRPGTELVDDDVVAGETYTYRVVAVDESGNESEAAAAGTEAR